jgi:hypothetical protein
MKRNTYDTIISLPISSYHRLDCSRHPPQSNRKIRIMPPEREDGSISWRIRRDGVIGCPFAVYILPPRQQSHSCSATQAIFVELPKDVSCHIGR